MTIYTGNNLKVNNKFLFFWDNKTTFDILKRDIFLSEKEIRSW